MKTYYKARVVHDVMGEEFVVQYRKHWFSLWVDYLTYRYDAPNTHRYIFRDMMQARELAINKADSLVAESVIYTTDGFDHEPYNLFD